MTNRYLRNLIVWAVILAVALPFALQLWRRTPREVLDYSVFVEQVQAGQVTQVEIGDGKVDGRLKSGQQFTTYLPQGDTSYIELLKAKGVLIKVEPRSRSSLWPSLLSTLLPIVLLVGLWMLMLRQAQSGSNQAMSFGKSRARLHT
ncbi:MAG: ATP-dependent metallopeptidase FtsH/Yme1/Tma family protein, partial [bacterium]